MKIRTRLHTLLGHTHTYIYISLSLSQSRITQNLGRTLIFPRSLPFTAAPGIPQADHPLGLLPDLPRNLHGTQYRVNVARHQSIRARAIKGSALGIHTWFSGFSRFQLENAGKNGKKNAVRSHALHPLGLFSCFQLEKMKKITSQGTFELKVHHNEIIGFICCDQFTPHVTLHGLHIFLPGKRPQTSVEKSWKIDGFPKSE